MSPKTVAVVTGANKGIGLAIVRHLALQYPKSSFNQGPFLVYLTARNKERGEQALEDLLKDKELSGAKALSKDGGLTDVKYHALDISETKSIQELQDFLKKEHPDGVDIVINNAGIAMNGFDSNVVKETLECNYYGTLEACQDLLPLIKPQGRLVNVASMAGSLTKYPPAIRESFHKASTVPEVTSLMETFKSAVATGKHEEQGWPSAAYAVSKAGVIGMTKALAKDEADKGGQRLINVCCPGYVATDMTKMKGYKTVDQGAETPVLLGLGNIGSQTGLFWQSEKPIQW